MTASRAHPKVQGLILAHCCQDLQPAERIRWLVPRDFTTGSSGTSRSWPLLRIPLFNDSGGHTTDHEAARCDRRIVVPRGATRWQKLTKATAELTCRGCPPPAWWDRTPPETSQQPLTCLNILQRLQATTSIVCLMASFFFALSESSLPCAKDGGRQGPCITLTRQARHRLTLDSSSCLIGREQMESGL